MGKGAGVSLFFMIYSLVIVVIISRIVEAFFYDIE
jgi:hypothetical protein